MPALHAYVALGSNLGNRRGNLEAGLRGLADRGLRPDRVSSIWETSPVGSDDPRWYLNMAVRIPQPPPALDLLDRLLEIERDAGRVRSVPNAPRTLDLDLLMRGDDLVRHPRLHLPHPRMWSRRFVLVPLAEIAPDLRDPESGRTVGEALARLGAGEEVRRVYDPPPLGENAAG